MIIYSGKKDRFNTTCEKQLISKLVYASIAARFHKISLLEETLETPKKKKKKNE